MIFLLQKNKKKKEKKGTLFVQDPVMMFNAKVIKSYI